MANKAQDEVLALPHHQPDVTGGGDPVRAFLNKCLYDGRRDFYSKWNLKLKTTDTMDNFTLHKVLGSGSFGEVYAATYKGPNMDEKLIVAVKMLKKAHVIKTRQVSHTLSEKKISMCLEWEFLMKTFFGFQDSACLYLVMDFMSGGEFYEFLRKKGSFPEAIAQFYAGQIAMALQYMHTMQLVYRDLKPENILIGGSGYVKLGDFGFAKYVPGRTWTLCGTPQYMAPELLMNKSYGKSVDCWGLGILIYELVAGYVPFDDNNVMKMYEKIVACNTVYPKNFSSDIVDLLKYVIQPDVTKRYGNLKDGMFDVIQHKWFKKVDFVRLYKQLYKPPWKPKAEQVIESISKAHTRLKVSKVVNEKWQEEFEDF